MREDLGSAFEGFVERKWQDALNVAAAEPLPWGTEKEKTKQGDCAMLCCQPTVYIYVHNNCLNAECC
jgi:hypothetical protein